VREFCLLETRQEGTKLFGLTQRPKRCAAIDLLKTGSVQTRVNRGFCPQNRVFARKGTNSNLQAASPTAAREHYDGTEDLLSLVWRVSSLSLNYLPGEVTVVVTEPLRLTLIGKFLALPKKGTVGGVSDADFVLHHNVLWCATRHRGRRPVLQRVFGQSRKFEKTTQEPLWAEWRNWQTLWT